MFDKLAHMDMLHGPLWGKLALFALPLALTSVLQQLCNAADVMVLGRYVGNDEMAAVGNNIPIVALIVCLFVGLSLGSNVVMARYIGRGEPGEATRAMHSSLWLALASGLLIAAGGWIFAPEIIVSLGVPEAVREPALVYLRWYFLTMPFISFFNFEAAFFRSVGDTGTPLVALAITCAVNAAGDVLAVTALNGGITGVAAATLVAYAMGAAFLWHRLRKAQGLLHLDYKKLGIFDIRKARAALAIGLPAGIQGMVFAGSNIVIQAFINELGADAMAGSAAAFSIEINVYCCLNAFGMAATTFIGQNAGAGSLERCRRVFWDVFWWDMGIALFMSAVGWCLAPWLLSFFTDKEEVGTVGMIRLLFVLVPQALNALIEIFSGALRGYGFSLPPALIALVCVCGERLIWVYTMFPLKPDYTTLMETYPISWALTVLLLWAVYAWFMKYRAASVVAGKRR